MTMMDERVAERRKGVSEDRARKRLKTVLIVLFVVLSAAGAYWLVRSPVLSISAVEVHGAFQSDPGAYVRGLDMTVGTPTIDVRPRAVQDAVESDPWVASASVSVSWPGRITIDVVEHLPVVAAMKGEEWYLVSADGTVLVATSQPPITEPSVVIDLGSTAVGATSTDPMMIGALLFLDALAADRLPGTVMSVEGDGLFALVEGHRVRLGRPVEMFAKATVLGHLLEEGLSPGASIDLIAPSRPAVEDPQPQPEAEE